MAPAIGMQMKLVLLGLSSGLQLGQHRYAWKVNQLAAVGAGGVIVFWMISLEPDFTPNVSSANQSKLRKIHLAHTVHNTFEQNYAQLISDTLKECFQMTDFV